MDTKKIMQVSLMVIFISLTFIAGCNLFKSLGEKKGEGSTVSISGRIEGDEYNAGAKTNGKVERILVNEGDEVKKGQLLGYIYSEQLKAALASAKEEVRIWQNKILQSEAQLAQARADTSARVNQARANLNVSHSQLNKAESTYRQSLAQLDRSRLDVTQAQLEFEQAGATLKKAKANLDYCEKEYERHRNLFKEDAIPKTKFDAVETQYISAREDFRLARMQVEKARTGIESSRRNLNIARANVDIGSAGIKEGFSAIDAGKATVNLAGVGIYDVELKQKEVNNAAMTLEKMRQALDSAKADLEDSKVYAPINGVVVSKVVEPGEVVAGGTPLVTLVDMDALYLRVFLSTAKSGKLKIGNPVKVKPDALPGDEFEGYVYQVSSKSEFTPKNVETRDQRAKLVFSIKIRIQDNKDRKLKPGMPAEALIDTTRTIAF
jgi:HlyD family secretion protein